MAPQTSPTDLTSKHELVIEDAHTTKKASRSNTFQLQERCDWRKLMYILQHFDELQLSQEKKVDVIKYAKFSVPAVNQCIRSITIKYSQAIPGLGRFTARGPSLQTVPRTIRHTTTLTSLIARQYYSLSTASNMASQRLPWPAMYRNGKSGLLTW